MTEEGGLALDVAAVFAAGESDLLAVDEEGAPFVLTVEYATPGARFRAAARAGPRWMTSCRAGGCSVRYRFALGKAAAVLDDPTTAGSEGGLVIAPPSTWLLRPLVDARAVSPAGQRRFRYRVRTEGGTRFASGTARAAGAWGGAGGTEPAQDGSHDEFEADTATLDGASFAAFGPMQMGAVESGQSRVDVAMAPRGLALSETDTLAWINRAVTGIADYYGRFPVRRTLIIVVPGRHGDTTGITLGEGGPSVLVSAAAGLTPEAVRDDWVVTHELLHVTLPSLGRKHAWLEEGIATYVEPIVRARAGLVTPERFWRDLVEGLPKGLPGRGDEGLERTHAWGRTYWGGALFCLVADLRIRERTQNRRSIDDVLRAASANGDVESHLSVERFLELGDRATQTSVLAELYRELALAPGSIDLDALWSHLGIRAHGGPFSFDDSAPLASVRKAITARSD